MTDDQQTLIPEEEKDLGDVAAEEGHPDAQADEHALSVLHSDEHDDYYGECACGWEARGKTAQQVRDAHAVHVDPEAVEPVEPDDGHHSTKAELIPAGQHAALEAPAQGFTWSRDQVDLVKRTVAKGSSDDELRLFMHVCQRTGLDPFAKQIYFIRRWDADAGTWVFQPQTAIDGLRLIAERTGELEGVEGPWWCGEDGDWKDVWLSKDPPAAAKVIVKRRGREPRTAVAVFSEFVQKKKDGKPTRMWSPAGMPSHMIAKCAEAIGLRGQFPQELGDVYSFEELPTPVDQGPDAEDAVIVNEEGDEPGEKITVREVDELRAQLAMLEGVDGWSEQAVIQAAARSFKRNILNLADLRMPEYEQIMEAAGKVRT